LGCGRARLAEVGFVDFAVSMLPAVCFFWEMVMCIYTKLKLEFQQGWGWVWHDR
jgi:hypothetical protein